MLAREDVELTIEDGSKANVTSLSRVDRNVLVPLTSLLSSQQFSVSGVLLDLAAQASNLVFVIIETLAQMLFHLLNLRLGREQVKKIFDFEDRVLPDDLESLFDTHLLLGAFTLVALKQCLGNLHPQLLPHLVFTGLVSVLFGGVNVLALESKFDCFRVEVQDAVEDDLSLFHLGDLVPKLVLPIFTRDVVNLLLQLLLFLLADIQSVVDFEEDGLPLFLVDLFALQEAKKLVCVLMLSVQVEGQVVN